METLTDHHKNFTSVAALHDGKVASTSTDGSIKIWDLESSQCLQTLRRGCGFVTWLYNGRLMLTRISNGTIGIWDFKSALPIRTLGPIPNVGLNPVELPNGRLALISDTSNIVIWDWESNDHVRTIQDGDNPIEGIVSLPNGNLASISNRNNIKIWDWVSGQHTITIVTDQTIDRLPACQIT